MKSRSKLRITYFHIGLSSFVKKDIELLSRNFDVRVKFLDLSKKSSLLLALTKQFFYLFRYTGKTDIFVSQFGGYHSYLPAIFAKLFGRKSIVVLGGTDTVSFPSIQYGAFYLPVLKWFTQSSYKHSSLLLPVSENLVYTDYDYTNDDFDHQGYKFFCPKVKTLFKVIYNGYKTDKWFVADKEEKTFVTIGANLNSRFGFKLKGIDLLVDVAKELPDCKFYIIGGADLTDLPSNVEGISNMPHDEIPEFLSTKQFYLQLSMSEGFPNALSEAMLSGCTPIVSNVGAMPHIVSDERLILKKKDKTQLLEIIENAMEQNGYQTPHYWRSSIADRFSIEMREKEFVQAIKSLID